ncbi:hypothetical protein [Actinomadura rupiterrae]|uniref:hypothetical protein n=1 Tax=Actinomadura rupiterrae TaxID=559627 RepID=UPI0020A4A31F|nr:hypothetical protein [Actinomadura rupiterrae]MCP2338243.1 hypothetical protein [Actinomadura rupiterrae]
MRRSDADHARREALHDFAEAPLVDARRVHLEALGKAIRELTGLRARVVPVGPAFLRVVNPKAAGLAEDVRCDLLAGEWWFVWSWGDSLGPADDPDGAARAVEHVLTPGR